MNDVIHTKPMSRGYGTSVEAERATQERDMLITQVREARKAAEGDSNDSEICALQEALDMALGMLGIEVPDEPEPEPDDEVTLEFLIDEKIYYTGRLTVSRADVERWLRGNGLKPEDLTPSLLQDYAIENFLDHEEVRADVQGQEWRQFADEEWDW